MNTVLDVKFFFLDVVNLVSRGVLERNVGYCNHSATLRCLNAIRNRRDFSCPNPFHFLKLKYVFKVYMLIDDTFSI